MKTQHSPLRNKLIKLKKEITNINHDDFSNKNKLTKPILVKTITIDNGINISEILNNIKY